MDATQIVLKLALEAVGHDFTTGSLETFDDRLSLQKKVYLSQLTGADLGYRFGWYIYGPYSNELTADAFRLRDDLFREDDEFEKEKLNSRVRETLARAPEIWSGRPDGVDEPTWLELLASLHFLKHIAYWPDKKDPKHRTFDAVFKSLAETKPRLKNARQTARRAWNRLAEVGLITSKTLA